MANLFRMDLYRMVKARGFKVCLLLTFLFAAGSMPLLQGLTELAIMFAPGESVTPFPPSNPLSDILRSPLSMFGLLLALLSVVFFFYADIECGYIKNIAGQMPKRGFSVLSRYLASVVHSAIFMVTAVIGSVIGTLIVMKLDTGGDLAGAVLTFFLKLLLLQSICAVLLLVTTSFRSKSFGIVLAVLFGVGAMGLLYAGIETALNTVIKGIRFSPYMPDILLDQKSPDTLRAVLSAAVTITVFLGLSIRVFDRKDVK